MQGRRIKTEVDSTEVLKVNFSKLQQQERKPAGKQTNDIII